MKSGGKWLLLSTHSSFIISFLPSFHKYLLFATTCGAYLLDMVKNAGKSLTLMGLKFWWR